MQIIPSLPLAVAEIEQMPAFSSGNPAVVRGLFYLLDAAWRSDIPGTLRSDLGSLSRASRLSEDQVQSNWDALLGQWELRDDGRLALPALCKQWTQAKQHYGDALQRMEAALLVLQADARSAEPEVFELVGQVQETKVSPNKGKRVYPNEFEPNETSLEAMVRSGYQKPEEQMWLLRRFADYGRAERRMYVDWQAAYRNFLDSTWIKRDFRDHFGYALGAQAAAASGGALQKLRHRAASSSGAAPVLADTFPQRQLGNARTMLAAAAERRGLMPAD